MDASSASSLKPPSGGFFMVFCLNLSQFSTEKHAIRAHNPLFLIKKWGFLSFCCIAANNSCRAIKNFLQWCIAINFIHLKS